MVDIIIPVHNALYYLKKCLYSIEKYTKNFKIIIINDSSDENTTNWIKGYSYKKNVTLIECDKNIGYTRSINIGLSKSNSEYIVLLNSDTIVTEYWIEKMIYCMNSDKKIGIVGPLSNAANWQNVPHLRGKESFFAVNELPENITIDDFSNIVSNMSEMTYPKIPFINGFCFMIKRDVIKCIGYFDELNFPYGYGEENDYCLRASEYGFKLAVADNVFVYHAKSKSFGHDVRIRLSKCGQKTLLDKHGKKLKNAMSIANQTYEMDIIRYKIQEGINMFKSYKNNNNPSDMIDHQCVKLAKKYYDDNDFYNALKIYKKLAKKIGHKYFKINIEKCLKKIERMNEEEFNSCLKLLQTNKHKKIILLCTHDYSITGAPMAVYNTAKLLDKSGYFPVVIGIKPGNLKTEYKKIGINAFCSTLFDQCSLRMKNLLSLVDFLFLNTVLTFNIFQCKPLATPFIWRISEGKSIEDDYKKTIPALKRAEKLYAVSSYTKEILHKYNKNVDLLHYGIKDISNNYLKNYSYPKPGDKIKYCIIGNFCSRKGHDIIFDAYNILSDDMKMKTDLYFIGEVGNFQLPMTHENIHICGILCGEEKFKLLASCDILLCPSRDDPNPQVVMEGMMMRKPCIITTQVGQKIYISNEENGFLINPESAISLADLFITIYNKIEILKRVGENSYNIFKKYFDLNIYRDKLFNIIESCVENKFTSITPAFKKNNIAIIFSCNESYAIYLGVAIRSLIYNSSETDNYDIIILQSDLTEESKLKILSVAKYKENISIRFINMQPYYRSVDINSFYLDGYVPIETYNKFFLQQILSDDYKRCVYLDSDIIIEDNISNLYNIDLKGKPIGASHNVANINAAYRNKEIKNKNIKTYFEHTLGLNSYKDYFQAGVIVLDLKSIKNLNLLDRCLEKLRTISTPIYFDQCIYNSLFNNNVTFFSTMWNYVWYIRDDGRLKDTLPTELYLDFIYARNNPSIIHYAGAIKAHHDANLELSKYFWKYAKMTEFYHEILFKCIKYSFNKSNNKFISYNSQNASYCCDKPIFIHLHVHYKEHIEYFIRKIKNINSTYDLFVTINDKENYNFIYSEFSKNGIQINLDIVDNIGYDIYPFIQTINKIDFDKYDIVLKLHTKNKRKNGQDTVYGIKIPDFCWRDSLVDSLIKSNDIFQNNIKLFRENKRIGMIGSEKFLFDIRENNEETKYNINNFKNSIGVKTGFHYFAGTMFMCRSCILKNIQLLNLHSNYFAPSLRTKDYENFAHIMERFFGIIVEDAGFIVKGV